MLEPLLQLSFSGRLDLLLFAGQYSLPQQQAPQTAILTGPHLDQPSASAQQIAHRPSLDWVDVSGGHYPSQQQLGQRISITPIGFHLGARDQVESESVSQDHFETRSLQTIYQPVPVEGALDHDLQIGLVGLKQLHYLWQLVTQLLLHHNL